MARLAVNGWWGLALSCSIAACRAHETLCDGGGCQDAPQLGEGGTSQSTPDDVVAGEAGGSAVPPACVSDRQCQNASRCDGEERCTATGCEPGTKLDCEHGTKCDDAADELCVYPEPSPWLLATSAGALVALPTAQLGREPAFTIASKPGELLFEGFSRIFWSPDGTVAIVQADEEEFGLSYHYARFGPGLPSAVSLLPDVPNYIEASLDSPHFSADSEYVFIYDSNSGTYLLNLRDPTVPTRYIQPVDGGAVYTAFCHDQRSWLAWATPQGAWLDQAWIVRIAGDELEEQSIGELDGFDISSDRRLLMVDHGLDDEGNELGFVLRPCSTDVWSVEFPEVGYQTFSPDSQLLWVEENAGVQRVLSLEDPSKPVELLASDDLAATLTSQFTPDSKHLLARVDGVPYLVDLRRASADPLVPLGLPETGDVAVLRNAALLAWPNEEAAPHQLIWQAVPPRGAPIALLEDVTSDNSQFFDDAVNADRVFLARVNLEKTELFSILLDGSEPVAKLLMTIEGTFHDLTAAPDQSGIVFARGSAAPGGTLMFAPFEPSGALGTPRLVAEAGYIHEFQPWL